MTYDLSEGVTAEEIDESLVGEFYRSQTAFKKVSESTNMMEETQFAAYTKLYILEEYY